MVDISQYGLLPVKPKSAMIGDRFGRLEIIAFGQKGRRVVHAITRCDCGNITTPILANLRAGTCNSCGCLRTEIHKSRKGKPTSHGLSRHPLYQVWKSMILRCYDPAHPYFHRYGGRGIYVCERWRTPEPFVEDMWPSYQKGLSLDRIDNEKGYFPTNCRWATNEQQANNKSSNKLFTHDGKTLTHAQWGREWGVTRSTAARRINSGRV